jgi:hypothetical protein
MNEKMAKIGLKVKLIKTDKTYELHGVNHVMTQMVGQTFTISKAFRSSCFHTSKQTLHIHFMEDSRSFTWDPDDVQPVNFSKTKPKGGKFDPRNLLY